jgi:hypothetical protein
MQYAVCYLARTSEQLKRFDTCPAYNLCAFW